VRLCVLWVWPCCGLEGGESGKGSFGSLSEVDQSSLLSSCSSCPLKLMHSLFHLHKHTQATANSHRALILSPSSLSFGLAARSNTFLLLPSPRSSLPPLLRTSRPYTALHAHPPSPVFFPQPQPPLPAHCRCLCLVLAPPSCRACVCPSCPSTPPCLLQLHHHDCRLLLLLLLYYSFGHVRHSSPSFNQF